MTWLSCVLPAANSFERKGYLLKYLMKEWEQTGLSVQVIRGTRHFVSADILIPHVDMTITPAEYRSYLNRCANVVNRQVVDISKRRISGNLVGRNDSYAGPVIVKTDRNSGGLPERQLGKPRDARPLVKTVLHRFIPKPHKKTALAPWGRITSLDPMDYPVYSSVGQVPEEVFGNPDLVVEKFVPEIDGDEYCVRFTYFFGNSEASLLLRSKEKVIKGDSAIKIEEVPTPPGIDAIRHRLGFDFGKVDYVIQEGKPVIFDANRARAIMPSS